MCFKPNIFHDNMTGNVYEEFFSQKYYRLLIGIGICHKHFCGHNLICKILQSLCWSHVLIKTELQPATQNSSNLHHRCSHESVLKRWKTLKNIRKMYVIEFPFNKILRLHSTVYYRIKNSTSHAFLKMLRKEKLF